jgi:hypothetical protein
LIDGTARDETPLERELIALVRKTYEQPARLNSSDLDPIREITGDGALDYALVIGAFHFINRIADLLHVDPEVLPDPLRRLEFLRRLTVRLASVLLTKMDLGNRDYRVSYEQALEDLAPLFERAMGKRLEDEFAPLESRPKLIEALRLSLEERDIRSSLDRETLAKVHQTVEAALPASIDEAEEFHTHPKDPIEAYAFVGTRYAYRATKDMIEALREKGYDDMGILDMAMAIADANLWARVHRLVGIEPGLFYIGVEGFN